MPSSTIRLSIEFHKSSLQIKSFINSYNFRNILWKRSLELICGIYEQIYESVHDSVNNYEDPNSLMNYKPEQIRILLL
jgi:hypothetical protein